MYKSNKPTVVGNHCDRANAVAFDQYSSVGDRVFGVNEMLILDATHYLADGCRPPMFRFDGLDILEYEHTQKSLSIGDRKSGSTVHRKYLIDEALDSEARID